MYSSFSQTDRIGNISIKGLTTWKQKNPTIKYYPGEYWTWDLTNSDTMLFFLSYGKLDSIQHISILYLFRTLVHSELYRRSYIDRSSQQPRKLLRDDMSGSMNICGALHNDTVNNLQLCNESDLSI